MTAHIPDDLSPAGRDLRAYTDELRPEHPVVRNDRGECVLLRHDLVRHAALDPVRFSSEVSRFLQVPNGLTARSTPRSGRRSTRSSPRQRWRRTKRISNASPPISSGRCREASGWKRYGTSAPLSRSRRAPGWAGPGTWRDGCGVPDSELDLIIDEVLRIDDPFVTNRRVTTGPVDLGVVELPEGARVKLRWTSANRDEVVFGDPQAFDPAGHAADNLVYGTGTHACPGRLLANVELRIAVRALVAGTTAFVLDPEQPAEREVAPVGGWARVPVLLA